MGRFLLRYSNVLCDDILKWALLNKPAQLSPSYWNEIPSGMSSYVKALTQQLKNTTILNQCAVNDIRKYGNGFQIATPNRLIECDQIIIATNAYIASRLLKNVAEADEFKNALNKIEYFSPHIAIHGDSRLMPQNSQDWSIANIAYDNKNNSTLTISKPWMQEIPLFRSWITPNVWTDEPQIKPEPLYAERTYQHPKVTPIYFEVQHKIAALQGTHNIWIAGFYTHDIDSHNSAIVSAINVAKKSCPSLLTANATYFLKFLKK